MLLFFLFIFGNIRLTIISALDSIQRRPAVMSAEFYYTGDCNNPLVQNEIKLNFIITIQNSVSWNSKCQPTNCNIANIVVSIDTVYSINLPLINKLLRELSS